MTPYITGVELTAYATARGITLSQDPDVLLTNAMDYIESLSYIGYKTDRYQEQQWPRKCVYIDGVLIDDDVIPQLLKDALAQTAIAIDQGNGPLAVIERTTKREKVGPVEVEYSDTSSSTNIVRTVPLLLSKLLAGGTGSNLRVTRA